MKITRQTFTNIKIATISLFLLSIVIPLLVIDDIFYGIVFSILFGLMTSFAPTKIIKEIEEIQEPQIDKEKWKMSLSHFVKSFDHNPIQYRLAGGVFITIIAAIAIDIPVIELIIINLGFLLPPVLIAYVLMIERYLEPLHREIHIGTPKGKNIDLLILDRLEREMSYDITTLKNKRSKFILATLGEYVPKILWQILIMIFLLINGAYVSQFETVSSLAINLTMIMSLILSGISLFFINIYLSKVWVELSKIPKFNTDIKELNVMRRLFIEERDSIERS